MAIVEETHLLFDSSSSNPERSFSEAFMRASAESERRLGETGKAASMIAYWMFESASETTLCESFDLVLGALKDTSSRSDLGRAAHKLIVGCAEGTIGPDAFASKIRKPLRARASTTEATQAVVKETTLGETLESLLAREGFDKLHPDPILAWKAFKEFAVAPITSSAPVQHVTALFQWGIYGLGMRDLFEWDLTRQVTFGAASGGYDHMEQVHCTLYFPPDDRLVKLGQGDLWAGDDLEQWFSSVEAHPAFIAAMELGVAIESGVVSEHV
jgi:hypothetical protein